MPLREGILLVGTGRAAHHLGHAIARAGLPLTGVVGRSTASAKPLALALRTTPFGPDEPLPPAALTLLAVSDDAIAQVATRLGAREGVVAHLSGASDMDRLLPHAHRGVLWPVMSLSPGEPADLSHVPLVVDANGEEARRVLLDLARSLSGKVVELPLDQRRLVHLAAVFASNFPVALFAESCTLLERGGIPSDLLTPLWKATAAKAAAVGPEQALTGPARRGDRGTIDRHLAALEGDPDLRRAYALLSDLIAKRHPRAPDAR